MATEKIYVTGKTIDEAITKGLKELNAELTEISFKTINEGGVFSKAKIEMWKDEVEEDIAMPTIKEMLKIAKDEPKAKHMTINVSEDDTDKPVVKNSNNTEKTISDKKVEIKNPNEVREIQNFSSAPKLTTEEMQKVIGLAKEFLENLVKFSAINATVKQSESEDSINFDIEGENLGNIIGNSGETLGSIQLLVNVIAGKTRGFHKRIYVDAGGYKSSKDKEIIELALATAQKVRETGESIKLKPLTAYQRRVVHATLSEMEDVMTKSIGEEPNRNIFVLPKSKI